MLPRRLWQQAVLLCASALIVSAGRPDAKKVLVLLEDVATGSQYSSYLDSIKHQGYDIEIKAASDRSLQLRSWDDWLYSKLIIFASGVSDFGGAVDGEAILDFVDSGRSVVLAVDSSVSDELRNLAADLGVDVDPRGDAVIDHWNFVSSARKADHTLVVAERILESEAVFGPQGPKGAVLFRGTGLSFSADSEQVFAALSGSDTQLVHSPSKPVIDDFVPIGKDVVLVALVQTGNDARALVSGSMDLFSNKFFKASDLKTAGGNSFPKSANEAFAVEATKWVLHERGVLRASNLRHHPPGSPEPLDHYRITDDLEFSVDLHEYRDGAWHPYQASDVQLEFVMLDPYIRTFLEHDGKGTFSKRFKVPDVYGIFKFVVDYRRLGYTHIELSEQIPIRHFKHNEFERFILAAYPYYSSAFSVMIAFFIFGFVFLYHKEK